MRPLHAAGASWGTAAFFGKVQLGGPKGGPPSLTESVPDNATGNKKKGQPAAVVRGTAIEIPSGAGRKSAGQFVRARFLGGAEPALNENEPFRPRFAAIVDPP